MSEDRMVTRARGILNKLDRRFGQSATYRVPSESVPDIDTGATTISNDDTTVTVRALPYTIDEQMRLSAAGVTLDTVRWRMQTAHKSTVQDGDVLIVSGMRYRIDKAEKDQLGVDWTLYTYRAR